MTVGRGHTGTDANGESQRHEPSRAPGQSGVRFTRTSSAAPCVAHGMVQRSVGPATTQARIAATSDGTGSGSDHAPPNDPYGEHLHGDSLSVVLLRPDEKMRPAVLAPVRLGVLRAPPASLAVADDRDPVRPDALGHEADHRRLR